MKTHGVSKAFLATALSASAACALSLAGPVAPAHADASNQLFHIVGTDGDGVASRYFPRQWAYNNPGYGTPEPATVRLICYITNGDAVGPYGNTTWFWVNYDGRYFYVNDHWLDTPYVPKSQQFHTVPQWGVGDCGADGLHEGNPPLNY